MREPREERELFINNRVSTVGFTLVELLLYIAIFAIVVGFLTTIFIVIINSQKRESLSSEVSQQLNFVLGTVQRLVGDSGLIETVYEGQNMSAPCSQFCTLKLRRVDPTKDPTIISSNQNGIYLQEGANPQVTLTNNKVLIDNLKFTKHEVPGAHAVVEIDASLRYNTTNPRFAVTKTIKSAIARASAATFDADILPNQDSTFDIGQITGNNLRWRNGHFSQNLTVAGSIGISLTSPNPSYKLDVNGSVNAADYYKNGVPFRVAQALAYNEFSGTMTVSATSEGSSAIVVSASPVTVISGDIIEIEAYIPKIVGDGTGTLNIVLFDGSSPIGKLAEFSSLETLQRVYPASFKRRLQPSIGLHTYSIRAWRTAPNWAINAGSGGPATLVPAFIKVTRID